MKTIPTERSVNVKTEPTLDISEFQTENDRDQYDTNDQKCSEQRTFLFDIKTIKKEEDDNLALLVDETCRQSFPTRLDFENRGPFEAVTIKSEPLDEGCCVKRTRVHESRSLLPKRKSNVATDIPIESLHRCDICGARFFHIGHLRRHCRNHTTEIAHRCEICRTSFASQGDLKRHERSHELENYLHPYKCEVCGSKFAQLGYYKRHLRCHNAKETHTCEACGSTFSHLGHFKRHLLAHGSKRGKIRESGRIKCENKSHDGDVTESQFASKISVGRHACTLYECDVCQSTFTDKYYLLNHVQTHTEKPFTCDVCRWNFTTQARLDRHVVRIHATERPFECDHCGLRFTATGQLNRHLRIHTGEKRYECDSCEAKFTAMDNLGRHRLTHTRAKRK